MSPILQISGIVLLPFLLIFIIVILFYIYYVISKYRNRNKEGEDYDKFIN